MPDGGSLIRTSCYDEFGVYDESFLRAHDYQWWSRVCGKINFKHIGGCYYKWRWHDGNITGYDQERDRSYEAQTTYGMLSLYPLKSLFPDAGWGSRPENEAEAVSYLKAANAIGKWKDGEEVQKCIGQVTQRVSRQRAMELMEELGKEEMAKESEAFSNEDGEVKTGRGAKGDAYYDRIYEDSEQYHSDYKVSHYYEMWTQVLQLLRMVQEPRVLEIGCGTGQLAHYLYDEGFRHYHGFDFSEEAVRIASQRVPQSFCVADARAPETFNHNYNVVICLEVLEHVDDDLGILSNIHEGAAVILSVPSSDDPAHVRFFLAKDSVTRRYSAVLDIQEIVQIDRWFVCLGVKLPAVD